MLTPQQREHIMKCKEAEEEANRLLRNYERDRMKLKKAPYGAIWNAFSNSNQHVYPWQEGER